MSTALEIGERAAQARREKGVRERRDITQREVAKEIGVSPTTISDCESGRQIPGERVIQKLATYLGTTPAFLRYGIPETKAPRSEEQGAKYTADKWRDVTAEAEAELAAEDAEQASKTAPRKNVGRKR